MFMSTKLFKSDLILHFQSHQNSFKAIKKLIKLIKTLIHFYVISHYNYNNLQ